MIKLADGRTISSFSELKNLLEESTAKGMNLYTYFRVDSSEDNPQVIMDKLTFGNLFEVLSVDYVLEANTAYISLPGEASKRWKCENLADEYNLRNGEYKELLGVSCQASMKDIYSFSLVRIDKNFENNTPENIRRIYMKPNCVYPSVDYFSVLAKSLNFDFLSKYARELYPFLQMKLMFKKYITKERYDEKKFIFNHTPASFEFLLHLHGSENYLNAWADKLIRDSYNYKEPKIEKKEIKVCLFREYSSDDFSRLCREYFLDFILKEKGFDLIYFNTFSGASSSFNYYLSAEKLDKLKEANLFIFDFDKKLPGFTELIGIIIGTWIERKRNANKLFMEHRELVTEKDLAYGSQDVPRIILFTQEGNNLPSNYKNFILAHIAGYKEFEKVLEEIDFNRIDFLKSIDFEKVLDRKDKDCGSITWRY